MSVLLQKVRQVEVSGVVLLILLVAFLSECLSRAIHSFWGDFSGGAVYDGNVYKDNTEYADSGYGLNLAFGLRSKFSPYTFSRVHYIFELKNFSKYSLENQNSHEFTGLLKQRLGDFFTMDLQGGMKFSQLPNAHIYNSRLIFV